ncbi:MAG: hypothetical protein ABIN89_20010 [Chitinophagaceae bacterium]
MKLKGKHVWLALLIVITIAGIYAYREYNRKPADLSNVASQSSTTADSLVMLFEKDELKANALYLGKAIDVTGVIAEITNQKDTIINVTLGKKDDMHRVSCLMDVQHINDVKTYKESDMIKLRGICNGYLMDVELNRCVVIK